MCVYEMVLTVCGNSTCAAYMCHCDYLCTVKIQLEKERKERKKQKEKEKKERLKREGKPVTKAEREKRAKQLIQLEAMKALGRHFEKCMRLCVCMYSMCK